MKKWIAAALLTLPLIATAAPDGKSMDEHLDKRLEHMQKRLELNDEQVSELRGVFQEHKEELKTLHESMKADVEEVLTPEQLEKFEHMHEEHKDKRKNEHKGHHKNDRDA